MDGYHWMLVVAIALINAILSKSNKNPAFIFCGSSQGSSVAWANLNKQIERKGKHLIALCVPAQGWPGLGWIAGKWLEKDTAEKHQ